MSGDGNGDEDDDDATGFENDYSEKFSRERSLLEAAKKGDVAEMKNILGEEGVEPNWADGKGNTALIAAARAGHVEVRYKVFFLPAAKS